MKNLGLLLLLSILASPALAHDPQPAVRDTATGCGASAPCPGNHAPPAPLDCIRIGLHREADDTFELDPAPAGAPQLSPELRRYHRRHIGGHINGVFVAELPNSRLERLRARLRAARGPFGTRLGKLHIVRTHVLENGDGSARVVLVAHFDRANPNADVAGAMHHLVADVMVGTVAQTFFKRHIDAPCRGACPPAPALAAH